MTRLRNLLVLSAAAMLISTNVRADYTDQGCLKACKVNCGVACAGTAGSGKSACIKQCSADNKACDASCRRPGNPPATGTGGTGTTTPPVVVPVSCTGGTTLCKGKCVNLSNDTMNCGSCGATCPSGTNRCCGTSGCWIPFVAKPFCYSGFF